MKLEIQLITKIDAVKQQIDEAIWMFFSRRDPIAIHTIVGAAHQVLHDITDGQASMIKNVRAEDASGKGKSWYARLNKEYNYFKHADKDKDAIIRFDPLLHTYYLVDCVYMYKKLTGDSPKNHRVFDAWFALANPDAVGDGNIKALAEHASKGSLNPDNYEYFLGVIQSGS